jgi:hypothetical protein
LIEGNKEQLGQISQASFIPFPGQAIRADELFTYWLNISEPPSRPFCAVIGHFLGLDEDKKMQSEKLIEYSSKTAEGKSEYFRYC